MSAGEIAQVITAIAALGSMVVGAISISVSVKNGRKLEVVHQATNGLTSKLVSLTAVSSKAEGNLEGRAELTQEQLADPLQPLI